MMTIRRYKTFVSKHNQFLSECARVIVVLCDLYDKTGSIKYKHLADFCTQCHDFESGNGFNIFSITNKGVTLDSGDTYLTIDKELLTMTNDELYTFVSDKIKEEKSRIEERELHKKQEEETKERVEYERLKKKFG